MGTLTVLPGRAAVNKANYCPQNCQIIHISSSTGSHCYGQFGVFIQHT